MTPPDRSVAAWVVVAVAVAALVASYLVGRHHSRRPGAGGEVPGLAEAAARAAAEQASATRGAGRFILVARRLSGASVAGRFGDLAAASAAIPDVPGDPADYFAFDASAPISADPPSAAALVSTALLRSAGPGPGP